MKNHYLNIINLILILHSTSLRGVKKNQNNLFKIPNLFKKKKNDNKVQKISPNRQKTNLFKQMSNRFKQSPLFRSNSWSQAINFNSENNVHRTQSEMQILFSRKKQIPWFKKIDIYNEQELISSIYKLIHGNKYTDAYFSFILKKLPNTKDALLKTFIPPFFLSLDKENELIDSLQQVITAGIPLDTIKQCLEALIMLFQDQNKFQLILHQIGKALPERIIYLYWGYTLLLEKKDQRAITSLQKEINQEYQEVRNFYQKN